MKVGFYLENRAIPDVDFTKPEEGNPGCGGTEYLFASLPVYLKNLGRGRCEPVILANHIAHLPDTVASVQADDPYDAATKAKEAGCTLFVYRPKRESEMDMLDLLTKLALPTIMWVHVTPTMAYLRKIAANPYVRAFVCVEHEQHDQIFDTPLRRKLTYIVNGFDLDGFRAGITENTKDNNLVVYIGALVPQKGFHLLAQAWPEIIKRQPFAHLFVIGSGAVYNSNAKLGRWGIADSAYEEKNIIPFLSDSDGRPLPSVTFAGRMGLEKKAVLARALIGVPNPTGQGENCPGSAIEIAACATATVSGAREGMLDTIRNGETGLLGHGITALVDEVCRLLADPSRARTMGENGVNFVRERYDYQKVCDEWCTLFERLAKGLPPQTRAPKLNITVHQKWARILNRAAQETLGRIIYWPAVEDVKEAIVKARKRSR